MPCFEAGCSCPGPTPANAVLPVLPKEEFPGFPNKASSVVSKEPMPKRIRISQYDGSATTPEPSVSPEPSHESPEPPRSSPSRRRRPKSPAQQPNISGSLIRKIHESHRGGFRRSPRLQSTQSGLANQVSVAINPVPLRDRPAPPPSPLKQCDNASNSQQPAAPKVPATSSRPGRPRRSKTNNQTTPGDTGSSSAPSGSTASLQKAAVPPSESNCDCLSAALQILEELETQNHYMQDYSGPAISQHLTNSLVKCVEILSCKRCIEISKQMILMVIITQKITKVFSRLTTRFIEGDLPILSPERAVPLPRLVLIQQLKLEKALDQLKVIARSHDWKTHIAMLAPICQYSKDTMDRLRRMNGLVINAPNLVPLNEDDPIIVNDE